MEDILLYMAPMEGVTGYIYRRAYHRCFYPLDRYFTPFIAPKQAGAAVPENRTAAETVRLRHGLCTGRM